MAEREVGERVVAWAYEAEVEGWLVEWILLIPFVNLAFQFIHIDIAYHF